MSRASRTGLNVKGLPMASCEHAQAAGGQTAPMQFEENKLSEVKRVIAVLSGKGGVGKSLVTGSLAVELARGGAKVGILDADITGPSIPRMFGMGDRRAHGLGKLLLPEISATGIKVMSSNLLLQNETDPVLWRGPVIAGAIKQFWSDTSWARSTTCWSICLREPATSRSPSSSRCRSTASSSSRARRTWFP